LKRLKQWNGSLTAGSSPWSSKWKKLHTVLTHDMAQAIADLAQIVNTLASYADMATPAAAANSVRPAGQNSAEGIAAAPEAGPPTPNAGKPSTASG